MRISLEKYLSLLWVELNNIHHMNSHINREMYTVEDA